MSFQKGLLLYVGLAVFGSALSAEFDVTTAIAFENALRSVGPGDIINIADVSLATDVPFQTSVDGTWDRPIVIRGIGASSQLRQRRPSWEQMVMVVRHSNYEFSNLGMSGQYAEAVMIQQQVSNITLSKLRFSRNGMMGVFSLGKNVIIDQCDIPGYYYGIQIIGDDTSTFINNCQFTAVTDGAVGIMASGGETVIQNNKFDTDFFGGVKVKWHGFVLGQGSRIRAKSNTGERTEFGGFIISVGTVPPTEQAYAFYDNHCDLQFNTYCINVDNAALYNRTFVASDNTYENGRGVTNVPQQQNLF